MTATLDELQLDLSGLEIEEDKPKRTRNPNGATSKRRTVSDASLLEKLLLPWAGVTMAVSGALPLTGAVLEQRGEPTVKALIDLSKDHPKMRAALNKISKVGPASELVQTGALVLIAVAMETGRLPADNMVSRKMGMTDLFYQFHPDKATDTPDNVEPIFPYAPQGA